MNDFLNVLKNHWETIVAVFLFILSFILQLLKKKPVEILPSIMELIYKLVPQAICEYEKLYGSGNGSQKKESVVNFVMNAITRVYSLNDAQYHAYELETSLYIEKVLKTPQKKEK